MFMCMLIYLILGIHIQLRRGAINGNSGAISFYDDSEYILYMCYVYVNLSIIGIPIILRRGKNGNSVAISFYDDSYFICLCVWNQFFDDC